MRPLLLFVMPAVLAAEVHSFTLRQAADLALKQNPDVLLARLEEHKAAQQVQVARDPFFPKLYVGSGLAYSSGFPMSIEGAAPAVVQAKAVASVYDRQQKYRVAQARQDHRTSQIESQVRTEEAVFRTVELFLEAERRGRLVEMARRQIESAEKMESVVKARVEEGRQLPSEARRAALEVAKAKHRVLEIETERDHAEAVLAAALGLAPGDRVRPVGEERAAPELPSTAEAAVQRALQGSRELSRLESALLAKGLEIRAEKSARLPRLDLVAQYGLFAKFNNYEDFFQRFQRNNGQLGVSLQIPLLFGPTVNATVAHTEAEAARLRVEVNTTRSRLTTEAEKRFADLRRAESARQVGRLALDVAREDLSVALARFDEGRATLKEVEEARMAEHERWIAYYDAQSQLERARYALIEKTGGLLAALR